MSEIERSAAPQADVAHQGGDIACAESDLTRVAKPKRKEAIMRLFILAAVAITSFCATMTVKTTDANAVVCARGVVRAGCVGAGGAAVVHRPVAACRYVVVNGVRVRRCV